MHTNASPLQQSIALRQRCQVCLDGLRRRARADGVPLAFDVEDLVFLASKETVCGYCHAPLSFDLVRFDHAMPTARGGRHTIDNLAVCCDRCNRLKGRLTAEEFVELR